jgi:catalase
MRKPCGASVRRSAITVLAVLLAVGCGGAAWGHVQTIARSGGVEFVRALDPSAPAAGVYFAQGKGRSRPNFDSFPPDERPRMQQQFREWQSLPPDQKDAMRRRMDEWNRMPPNERNRYQQRYQQWQQLSPAERRQLENNLQRWDNLSPQDRDSIRKRFRP